LELVPGSGKTEQLMYDSHTYYRIDATEKWVCTEQKCYVSLAVNTVELTKPIQTDIM